METDINYQENNPINHVTNLYYWVADRIEDTVHNNSKFSIEHYTEDKLEFSGARSKPSCRILTQAQIDTEIESVIVIIIWP